MSTQTGGGTPHTCKAVEHCHQLNERVSDLEGWLRLVDGATQAVSARLTELDESASHWHNTLARESRAHDDAIRTNRRAIEEVVAAVRRPTTVGALEYHCETCICEATALRGQVTR